MNGRSYSARGGVVVGSSVALGVLFGARHALEPDHLAAVTVLATDRRGRAAGACLGASWGMGHTAALVFALLFVGLIPSQFANNFELAVAVMLVVLGGRAVVRAVRQGHAHDHRHGESTPHVLAEPSHVHLGTHTLALRPLVVGVIHGLAGSGALIALVATGLPTVGARLAYVMAFGVGSTIGMATLSGLAGVPLARIGGWPVLSRSVAGFAGLVSIALGIAWARQGVLP